MCQAREKALVFQEGDKYLTIQKLQRQIKPSKRMECVCDGVGERSGGDILDLVVRGV